MVGNTIGSSAAILLIGLTTNALAVFAPIPITLPVVHKLYLAPRFNPLPTSISLGSNIQRQYNRQRFRSFLGEGNIIPQLYQRNYLYDWQFALNWKLSKSLNFNYTTGNNFVVRNYVNDDLTQDQTIGLWDGFFETGTPNIHTQNLQLNYELPLNKIPLLEFVKSTYSYESSYQWNRS